MSDAFVIRGVSREVQKAAGVRERVDLLALMVALGPDELELVESAAAEMAWRLRFAEWRTFNGG